MAPAGGIVNGAVARFKDLEANGPGWMYYGVNAADRGLGYRGSYMTLGGFIPYAEDDLGGLWSADLRSHLSNYGGFFSNVGAVRKQYVGGTILGVGVYWDYDGDQNQYSDTTITDTSGSYVFAGGQSYNQVGVSGEWLTDYGNLRSNGYIPVGTTAGVMGPFVGNSILCQNGINAALAGTDLELGVYVPGLSDWAGMVSVGGYAYGNSRYNLNNGQNVVPWFGGVYTRLDLTLIKNWDFSLQYNNDSYFDSTGFARLTYRMGGSRRRNVPDQMEQPMMRNEHIVRAHQTPEQAINPMTGNPFFVIHVDNTTSLSPNTGAPGTWEAPVTTLEQAQALELARASGPTAVPGKGDYDMVFVHVGQSLTCPYETPIGGYQFQANNQYLLGEGTSLKLCAANCGEFAVWGNTSSSTYPVITNPTPGQAAIVLTNAAGTTSGATVDHIRITGSPIGISDGVGLPAPSLATGPGTANVNDVQIVGNGAGQRGVEIQDLANNNGTFNFTNMNLQNLTRDGIVVSGLSGGSAIVNISESTINNTTGSGVIAQSVNSPGRVKVANSSITNSSQAGVFVGNANALVVTSTLSNNQLAGVFVQDSDPTIVVPPNTSNVLVASSKFSGGSVGIWGMVNTGTTNLTITDNTISTSSSPSGANGIILSVDSGTTGQLNAVVIGNKITPSINTVVSSGSNTSTSGSSTLYNAQTSSSIGNILLTTTGTLTNTGSTAFFSAAGQMNIKASDLLNLQSLNNGAGVATVPLPLNATVTTYTTGTVLVSGTPTVVVLGTSSYQQVVIPPPPNYNAALIVPLPPQ